jgi:hypothetical protein
VTESEVIGRDDVVAIRKQRDQVTEHERAGGEPMQEHDRRRVLWACLAVEQPLTVDGCEAVVNPSIHF